MNFDLGVWQAEGPLGAAEASRIYASFCRGETPARVVRNSAAVDKFYEDLIEKWPEIGVADVSSKTGVADVSSKTGVADVSSKTGVAGPGSKTGVAGPGSKSANKDLCPWSGPLHHSASHVLLSCRWSRAEDVYPFVGELAARHGLVLFDPQSEELYLPETEGD